MIKTILLKLRFVIAHGLAKFNLFFLLLFMIGNFLQGCSSSQHNHDESKLQVPAKWPQQPAQVKMDDRIDLPDMAWWRQLNNPELNHSIQQALHNNNSVHIAAANLQYAQAQLKQVKLNWIPGMSILSGYSQMPNLGDPGAFLALFPQYVLNIFQQIKQQKSAQYQVEASSYAQDGVRLTLIGQVSASYFTLLAQRQAQQIYQRLVHDENKLMSLYQSQYRAGLIAKDKIDTLASQIKQTQSQYVMTQHNIIVSQNALHFLLNQNPGPFSLKASFNQLDDLKIIPGNLPATVLKNRPDVREAEAKLKVANVDIGVARANLLPSVRLDSLLGFSQKTKGAFALNEAYLNTPAINPPVFGLIQASKARSLAVYYAYVETIKKALQEVDNALSAYSAYSDQLLQNQSGFLDEKKHCALVDSRYSRGIVSLSEVVSCQIKLDYYELVINHNKLEKMLALVVLFQDLGGGYHGV
ncbi:outer membrane efflux protein [Legionella gratiana]|uniref:Outer membrane efflux protein n=1 Tax=Legionella gratiana TaxID=45066 RepID=A0A378JLK7_9GAMM|nr:TolC family protein [Legionella gratiana]KTD09175.1 outer membrane efflux protein [Legionella gratiana]STX45610.1 outer membrane efflux protein [Legionella gratiana]